MVEDHFLRSALKRTFCIGLSAVLSLQMTLAAAADPDIENVMEVEEVEVATASEAKRPVKALAAGGGYEVPIEERYDVEWYIRYTDKETHAKEFAGEEHGFAPNGSAISVGFLTEIIDREGNIWTTTAEPGERTVWGPGVNIIYIEYECTGHIEVPEDPYAEAEELLSKWVATAKEADAALSGTDVSKIPTSQVVCETEPKSSMRLLSAAGMINDTDLHTVYIIAKDHYPTGICLKDWYGRSIVYSNDVMDEVETADGYYKVHRFILQKSYGEGSSTACTHDYRETSNSEASCLVRGVTKKVCSKCGDEKITYHAALGHIDANGDSVCDRCGYRVFEEATGDRITTTVSINGTEHSLNWTLVDESYQSGCLYIADTGIPVSEMGGYGKDTSYNESPVFFWLHEEFPNYSSVKGENILWLDDDGTSSYGQMLSEATVMTYRDLMAAGDYVTHTGDGTNLTVVHDDGSTGTVPADSDFSVRPAMLLKEPLATEASLAHWEIGDQVSRTIDGEEYTFTCVDENYSDLLGNHTDSALFLMDDVIPAGWGGEYVQEPDGTGHLQWVWHPGPVATFGDTNDYKYSNIRKFLDAETVFTAADLVIGVPNAYLGSTQADKFGQTTNKGLTGYSIGYQQMTARLFILSVEEAIKYREYLWRFGSETENPDTVKDSTCNAYWLRSPNGTAASYYATDMCYVVDLTSGNIHPEYIKPAGGTGDVYLDTQTNVGIRPAFTLPNR